MSQPFLFDPPPDTARPHKAVNVPRTSVLAYQERPRDGRVAAVVEALAKHWVVGVPATSAELAMEMYGGGWERTPPVERLLYVRRGLSDARKLGLVEHAGERKCAVTGRQCVTWRVRTR